MKKKKKAAKKQVYEVSIRNSMNTRVFVKAKSAEDAEQYVMRAMEDDETEPDISNFTVFDGYAACVTNVKLSKKKKGFVEV